MDFRRTSLASAVLVISLITGCSNGGGGNYVSDVGFDADEGGGSALAKGHGEAALSESDIAGVWDASGEVEGENYSIETYVVIDDIGLYAEYDYLGNYPEDSQNCYERTVSGYMTANGDGTFDLFLVSAGIPFTLESKRYSVVGGNLTAPANLFFPTDEVVYAPPASITEEEITSMLCETEE